MNHEYHLYHLSARISPRKTPKFVSYEIISHGTLISFKMIFVITPQTLCNAHYSNRYDTPLKTIFIFFQTHINFKDLKTYFKNCIQDVKFTEARVQC